MVIIFRLRRWWCGVTICMICLCCVVECVVGVLWRASGWEVVVYVESYESFGV
jgi:hypothetical protein